jgi:hypothetical protein
MAEQRDVDQIIDTLRARIPDLSVVQMVKFHPPDDDGLWWFRIPNERRDIQIESSTGNCPFIVECTDDKSSNDARTGSTPEEVVNMVEQYLASLR